MMFDELLEDLLREGHAARFVADGDSMHPTIRAGDRLEILRVPLDTLAVGDVILTRAERGLTAHRVVRIESQVVITRGDNALADDAPIPLSAILGRVQSILREGVSHDPAGGPSRLTTLIRHGARRLRRSVRRR